MTYKVTMKPNPNYISRYDILVDGEPVVRAEDPIVLKYITLMYNEGNRKIAATRLLRVNNNIKLISKAVAAMDYMASNFDTLFKEA